MLNILKITRLIQNNVLSNKLRMSFSSETTPKEDLDMVEYIFKNNREWVKQKTAKDPEYFSKLKNVHKPKVLLIGCADARVPAQSLMGLNIGELFVHRNIANQVQNNDLSLLSVLQYGIEYLKVKDIFLLGHYECGGVRAATVQHDHGLIEHWLYKLRELQRIHADELLKITDLEERYRRIVELNVQEQCLNLLANPIVQKSQKKEQGPRISGFVYDVANGYLKTITPDFNKTIKELGYIYDLYHVHDKKQN